MKTLFLECAMGAAGDMLLAALLELHPDPQDFLQRLNSLGIPGVKVAAQPAVKCGITGTHVTVTVHGEEEESHDHHHSETHEHNHTHEHTHHHQHGTSHEHVHEHHDHSHDHGAAGHNHSGIQEIELLLKKIPLSAKVYQDVLAVYRLIAEAESHAHGAPIEQIHFHEVGTMDAVADIVGVCTLIEELAPEQILATAIHVGSGQVRCAHGVLPVPAPATAHILREVPIYSGNIRGELCTPTGAALLKHFVAKFGAMPQMTVSKIGYGMGKKDFEAANCVRAFLGEAVYNSHEVVELVCNLDDMTPEALGFAQQILMESGALDVYTTAIGMKKNRPGILLTCMCRREKVDEMVGLIFKHTTTLGMRETVSRRYALRREEETLQTAYGSVRLKTSKGWGVSRSKPEYEDLARIARDQGISLVEAQRALEKV